MKATQLNLFSTQSTQSSCANGPKARELSSELLSADPEAFEEYFNITRKESEAHNRRLYNIERAWADFLSRPFLKRLL